VEGLGIATDWGWFFSSWNSLQSLRKYQTNAAQQQFLIVGLGWYAGGSITRKLGFINQKNEHLCN
jgi:hypothetical protein